MKKIVALTIAFLVCVGMTSIGTWAYLSDTETSTGNLFAAGTLDMKTNDADGVTMTLYAVAMKPGDTVGPSTIQLRNAGSVNGASVNLAFSYVENDSNPNPINMSANATAAVVEVTTLNYDGSSILGSVSDNNINGYIDIQDVKDANLTGLSGINASATKNFEIAIQLRSNASKDFQADGITITMTFTLNQ